MQTILSWKALEHPVYPKTFVWYLVAGGIVLTIVVYGILTQAITMAIAFLVFAGVYYLVHRIPSQEIEYKLTTLGIQIGERFLPYTDIESFFLVYDPQQVATLNIRLKKGMNRDIMIQMGDADPADIREVLLNRGVFELEGKGEPFIQVLSRLLRL